MKNIKKFKLFENPNSIYDYEKKVNISWRESENISFTYYFGEFVTSDFSHYELMCDWEDTLSKEFKEEHESELRELDNNHGRSGYTGRLFMEEKIITFWFFPENQSKLREIGKDILIETGIDIYDGEWKIEILKETDDNDWGDEEDNWSMDEILDKIDYIPVKDYKNSGKRSATELAKAHLEIGKGGAKKGWGSRYYDDKLPKGMSLAQYRSKKTKNKYTESKLNESPDNVYLEYDNVYLELNYRDNDAYPFGYIEGYGEDSFLFSKKRWNNHQDLTYDHSGDYDGREMMYNSGRIWIDRKVISFWDYPDDYTELIKIIIDINVEIDDLGYKIDDDWLIEVIMNGDEQVINKYKFWGDSEIDGDQRHISDSILIKIKDYKGSGKRSTAQLVAKHLEVGKGGSEKGWGSRKYDDKLPSDISVAQYKDKKTKYKYTEKMNYIKKYESPDEIRDYSIFPSVLIFNENDAIVFGYADDKMLVFDMSTHSSLGDNNDYFGHKYEENRKNDLKEYWNRNSLGFPGRLWYEHKVISFWRFPSDYNELQEVIKDIEKEVKITLGLEINITDDWWIDVVVNVNDDDDEFEDPNDVDWNYSYKSKLIKIGEYHGSKKRSAAQMAKKHLEVGKGGADVPKGFGSKKYDEKLPKGMSLAKYKNDKTKYKYTEGMKYLKKFENSQVQFTYNKELNEKFWSKDDKFDNRIREKLVKLGTDFYEDLDYGAEIQDIVLVGSLCNFNNNKYSDLDVHIVIDFTEISEDVDIVKKSVENESTMWNSQHDISIKGHDVEVYIQDITDENVSGGKFSLLRNEWIRKPKHNEPNIDKDLVHFKFNTYKSGIELLDELSKEEMSPEIAKKNYLYVSTYKKKIKTERQESLTQDGEFSVGNLVFKKLRNSGDYGKLIEIKTRLYDKIYSQK